MNQKYQIATKFPNSHKIYQMTVICSNWFSLEGSSKFYPIGIFGLKIYHLATPFGGDIESVFIYLFYFRNRKREKPSMGNLIGKAAVEGCHCHFLFEMQFKAWLAVTS
jgi:hypothetical protein